MLDLQQEPHHTLGLLLALVLLSILLPLPLLAHPLQDLGHPRMTLGFHRHPILVDLHTMALGQDPLALHLGVDLSLLEDLDLQDLRLWDRLVQDQATPTSPHLDKALLEGLNLECHLDHLMVMALDTQCQALCHHMDSCLDKWAQGPTPWTE